MSYYKGKLFGSCDPQRLHRNRIGFLSAFDVRAKSSLWTPQVKVWSYWFSQTLLFVHTRHMHPLLEILVGIAGQAHPWDVENVRAGKATDSSQNDHYRGHFKLYDSPRIERSNRGEPLEQSHRVKEREAAATWQILDFCFRNSDQSWCWNRILNLLIHWFLHFCWVSSCFFWSREISRMKWVFDLYDILCFLGFRVFLDVVFW